MSAAVLKIFTGLHRGAEIELSNGIYVIGSDDSCDLILHDSGLAARHAALHVRHDDAGATLEVEPLDGPVTFSGSPIFDSASVPALSPFHLGMVVAAWTSATASDFAAAWNTVEDHLAAAVSPAREQAPGEPSLTPENVSADDAIVETPAFNDAISSEHLSAETAEEAPASSVKPASQLKKIGLLASAALIGTLCFNWYPDSQETSPEETMRALLAEAGYEKLRVATVGNSLRVTGRIGTDKERGRLLRLARHSHYPVYLDVTVRSDAAEAVKASFNTFGLWPEVTELPPSKNPGLMLRGYIKNGVLEEQALTAAKKNVPALRAENPGEKPQLEIFREVKHEVDVQAVLLPALADAALRNVECIYHPGTIELRGTLTASTRKALEGAVEVTLKKLGVPAIFEIVNEADQPKPVNNIYAKDEEKALPAAARKISSGSFKIVSVSMGAMRFVTLDNDARVFEGGELPGGFILERVDVDALTLRKNGKTTLYPLRGTNE